ncbi:MAG TPA: hypothetical protein VGP07_21035 [Polyangia bacterium]|jgi:hypothetical protein
MRHRRRAFLHAAALATGLLMGCPSTVRARDDERVSARAELGVEYDNNVHRVEQLPADHLNVVGSPLARAVVGLSVSDRVAASQDVAISVLGAAKAFTSPAARSENVGIVESSGAWNVNLSPRTRLGAGATYYEAIQAGSPTERALTAERDMVVEARDFRSIVPSLRAVQALTDATTLGLSAGYRLFVYKPLPDYDFHAPVASLEHRFVHETADGDADWALVSALSVELRRFAGPRLLASAPDASGARHGDQFLTAQIDVTRTGRVLVGAGYALQWNRSNSFGESLLRHIGTIRFAASLPLGLYLAARTELVYVSYPDRLPLVMNGATGQANASIEEETRSEVRAELSRDIAAHLQLAARYSLYANALGQGGEYRRQTGTLSLIYATN